MKSICAWCNAPLSVLSPEADEQPVTHGICPRCTAALLQGRSMSLDSFVDLFDAEIVMVGEDHCVVAANGKARARFGKPPQELKGHRDGFVFGCLYAGRPEGCGNSAQCSECLLRQTVDRCLMHGENQASCSVTLKQGEEADKRCLIQLAIERIGDKAMIRIDSVTNLASGAYGGAASTADTRSASA